ncbi:MAG: tetratricopeptide repeat protein [Sandaracinus sp.]
MSRFGIWATLVSSVWLLASSPLHARAQEPTSDAVTEARTRQAAGEAAFGAGNYESALVEFERVYELLEGRPMRYYVLYNIGQCAERMFRYDRAIAYYERYLEEGGPEAEDRATVEATIRALETMLGTISLTANVASGEVWIDQQDIGPFDATHHEFRVPSGRHTIELRADGYVPAQADVQVLARASATASLELHELSDYEGIEPWPFWTSSGIAVAAAVVGAVFGGIALQQNADAVARCGGDPMCRTTAGWMENTEALAQSIRTNALVADVLYGTAGLFAVTSVVLAFLTDWDGPSARAPHADGASAHLHLAPSVGPSVVGLTLSGEL